MKKMRVEAVVANWDSVFAFLSGEMEAAGYGMEFIYTVGIAAEEIFVNVSHYAYHPQTGVVTIGIDIDTADRVVMQFEDEGIPYNPLAKEDPDTELTAESRDEGGLGIFMVKQMMDDVAYRYEDGKNVFVMAKNAQDPDLSA